MFVFDVDDVTYEHDRPTITGAEIMTLAGISPSDGLIQILPDGTRKTVAPNETVRLVPGVQFERAQLTAILDAARRHLADLSAALQRHDAGTYGPCERCSCPIPADQLAARPTTLTCIGSSQPQLITPPANARFCLICG